MTYIAQAVQRMGKQVVQGISGTRCPKSLSYRGISACIEADAGAELYAGRLEGITDIISFHARTVEGIRSAFHQSVDDYLALRTALDATATGRSITMVRQR